jgi:hypothetical protein
MNRLNLSPGLLLVASVLSMIGPLALVADDARVEVVNPIELARAGMLRAWTTQAELGAFDEVKFAQLHVSNSRATVFFEIFVGDELRKSYASLDRDALGNRLGYERARDLAELQREIIEQEVAASLADKNMSQAEYSDLTMGTSPEAVQKRQQFLEQNKQKVEVRKYVEPRMTLYVLNGHNVLQAFNAETGDLRWSAQVGPRNGMSMGLAANDAMVAVVNGQRAYCLDADQGRVLWNHRCQGLPNAPPAMSHTHIFVPLMDGRIESFSIAKDGVDSAYYVSHGRVSAQPLMTGRTVSCRPTRDITTLPISTKWFHQIGSVANGPIMYTRQAWPSFVCRPWTDMSTPSTKFSGQFIGSTRRGRRSVSRRWQSTTASILSATMKNYSKSTARQDRPPPRGQSRSRACIDSSVRQVNFCTPKIRPETSLSFAPIAVVEFSVFVGEEST